jgi:hypothetical protein
LGIRVLQSLVFILCLLELVRHVPLAFPLTVEISLREVPVLLLTGQCLLCLVQLVGKTRPLLTETVYLLSELPFLGVRVCRRLPLNCCQRIGVFQTRFAGFLQLGNGIQMSGLTDAPGNQWQTQKYERCRIFHSALL